MPTAVARDVSLSIGARHLYTVLDSRQGAKTCQRLLMATLAADMGVSDRTVRRYLAELVTAGYVAKKATGKSLQFTVINEQRKPRVIPSPVTGNRPDRSLVTALQSNNSIKNKKASSYEIPAITNERAQVKTAAAKSGVDSLTLEQFRDLLPSHLRPNPETHLSVTLREAIERGWTIGGLAAALKAEIPNPHAGPGMAVKMLRELSKRPPDEYTPTPPRPARYDPINECRHGVIKVYGGCEHCALDRVIAKALAEPLPTDLSEFSDAPY